MSLLPSFQTTPEMVSLIAEISELTGRATVLDEWNPNPRIQRANRINTVRSSLQIEGNTLTNEQVVAVLEGKTVSAPIRQIEEVRQAFAAYDAADGMDPCALKDFLRAHAIMMDGLTDAAGELRAEPVGVYAGPFLIHAGMEHELVPTAMEELFSWLSTASDHPLVKGCVFHGMLEWIHPFIDGNGRMGRLWHSLINQKWRPVMRWVQMETLVSRNQNEYYQVLGFSESGDMSLFVEFMLDMVRSALKEAFDMQEEATTVPARGDPPSTPQAPPKLDELVKGMLDCMGDQPLSAKEIMGLLGLSDRKSFRKAYLQPAIDAGVVELTIPDKPRSPRQRYRRRV